MKEGSRGGLTLVSKGIDGGSTGYMFASLTLPCTLWTLFAPFASLQLDISQLWIENTWEEKF